MPKITREKFIEATGREPKQDDLDRCNCPKAGQLGHSSCGWNEAANKPQFEIGPTWGMDMARPGSERTAIAVWNANGTGPPAPVSDEYTPPLVCKLPPDFKMPAMEPGEVEIVENPGAQVLLFERAADAIVALINRTPRSPTKEEIIAALKGLV